MFTQKAHRSLAAAAVIRQYRLVNSNCQLTTYGSVNKYDAASRALHLGYLSQHTFIFEPLHNRVPSLYRLYIALQVKYVNVNTGKRI